MQQSGVLVALVAIRGQTRSLTRWQGWFPVSTASTNWKWNKWAIWTASTDRPSPVWFLQVERDCCSIKQYNTTKGQPWTGGRAKNCYGDHRITLKVGSFYDSPPESAKSEFSSRTIIQKSWSQGDARSPPWLWMWLHRGHPCLCVRGAMES